MFLSAALAFHLLYSGLGFQLFWSDSTYWEQWGSSTMYWLTYSLGILFADRFLDLKEKLPKLSRLVRFIAYGAMVIELCYFIFASTIPASFHVYIYYVMQMQFFIVLALWLCSLKFAFQGDRSSTFYFAAAAPFLVLLIYSLLPSYGVIASSRSTVFAPMIGNMIEIIILTIALGDKIKQMQLRLMKARLDPLTGLPNRGTFNRRVVEEYNRYDRYGSDFVVAIIDMDNFKQVNDTFGHQVGDDVLVQVGQSLQECIRQVDFAARWGGEEFVLLLIKTDLLGAQVILERVRSSIAQIELSQHPGVAVTCSIGVAQTKKEEDASGLFKRADVALYQAKTSGKNRINSSSHSTPLQATFS